MSSALNKLLRNPGMLRHYILKFIKNLSVKKVHKDGQVFYVYKGCHYPGYLNDGNASSYILEKARQYCKGYGIDVGADKWPFPGAIPVQNADDQNAYRLDRIADGSLDYVFSSHCLEHLSKWHDALLLWIRKLKPGGILFLYLPHESMRLWNPGAPWAMEAHVWMPAHGPINDFLSRNGMEIAEFNPGKDAYWSFHIVAKKPA